MDDAASAGSPPHVRTMHSLTIVPAATASPASPARPAIPSRRRLGAMSALRVAAAAWLVGYHLSLKHLLDAVPIPGPLRTALANGSAVTGLFIMLSGFMMCFAYTDAAGRLRTSARELWVGRAARLWPIMILGHVLAVPFMFAGEERYGVAEAVGRAALSATALQGWVPGWSISFNGPAWTLSVLAFCYAVLPRLVDVLRERTMPQLVAILGATWVAMLVPTSLHFASLPTGFAPASDAPESLVEMTLHTLPLLRLPEFVAGVVLARLFALRGARSSATLAALGACAAAAAFLFLAMPRVLAERFVANGLLSPLYWALILGVASAPAWADRVAARLRLDALGEASLGVFLLHMPPLLALAWMRRAGIVTDAMLAFIVPVFVVAMFAASWLLEERFVRPLAARVKEAWGRAPIALPAGTPLATAARVTPLVLAASRGRSEPPTKPRPARRRSAA